MLIYPHCARDVILHNDANLREEKRTVDEVNLTSACEARECEERSLRYTASFTQMMRTKLAMT